nr:hypothetical protein [Tanacetum cinerariifolium]
MDSMISLGQKNTLAEYMILSGADNRPPMLDKDLYDSWKSRMELYIQNREHRRMILELVEHGPLIWPTIKENRVTMTKKYAELSAAEKIQADCDMKATNIILQGLPLDIYSLVNHHRVAKDLCERIQLLMQGTSLTNQERECKLLPPEWSKFVTDVKLVKDLHTTRPLFKMEGLQYNKFKGYKVKVILEKAMLAEAQEAREILDEEQLAFLVDPGVPDGQVLGIKCSKAFPLRISFNTHLSFTFYLKKDMDKQYPTVAKIPMLDIEDTQKKKNDVKARTTLLLSLPDEHQLQFSKHKTAKELWAAILKTFGGNEATKKTKKNLLKQQYGNFRAEGAETSDLNTMSLDDLYNYLKVYEAEVRKKSEPNTKNMAFISSTKHSRGNDEVNTASVYTASSNFPTASANVATINEDDVEEMDIKWNMALLSMRADKFWKKTGKKISI